MSYSNGRIGNKHLQGKANDYLAFVCYVIMSHLLYILNNLTILSAESEMLVLDCHLRKQGTESFMNLNTRSILLLTVTALK